MTLSDTDLEARLRRDLQARADAAPPALNDLAELTRARHRSMRRREFGVAGAVLAAVLVFVGVPVVSSTLTADPDTGRGQAAGPSGSEGRLLPPDAGLHELPTRGGLAEDEDWLADVAALSWSADSPHRDPGMEFGGPDPDSRHVAYADDVPSGRVALVVGLSGRQVVHAWFVGPRGANPDEMTVAAFPGMYDTDVVALVDGEPGADTLTLVVVAQPDDVVELPQLPVVDADGNEAPAVEPLQLDTGIAVVEVERRWAESDPSLHVQRQRSTSLGVAVSTSSRAEVAPVAAVLPDDPRGLAEVTELSPWNETDTGYLLAQYGLSAGQARPTLLAAGPVGEGHAVELVGLTFPSGATGMWLRIYQPTNPDRGLTGVQLPFAPAGTDLLDRVVAFRTHGGLVVSAPEGARADVLDAAGTLLESVPLTAGGGAAPLTEPVGASVRIVDADGGVVAEVPIEQVD
jgi:hypothetical protein